MDMSFEESPYLNKLTTLAWRIFVDDTLANLLNMVFLPLWFVSLFLAPWKFCTGSHYHDWKTIRGDYATGYKKVWIVLGITFKNIFKFIAAILSFICFSIIAVIVLITPWRLRYNLCTRLSQLYKDMLEEKKKGDHDKELGSWCSNENDPEGRISNKTIIAKLLFGELKFQIKNLFKDIIVIGASPILITSA
jgi:hypothetical protein